MISIKATGIKDAMLRLPDVHKVRKAASMALNRTARGVITEIDRGIRDEYTVKRTAIRSAIKSTTASPVNLGISIKASGRRLPLMQYQVRISRAKPKKGVAGVRARIRKSHSLKPIRRAFPAIMRGHSGIYQRKGAARFPVRALTGPSVHTMATSTMVMARAQRRAATQFRKEFNRNLERMAKK